MLFSERRAVLRKKVQFCAPSESKKSGLLLARQQGRLRIAHTGSTIEKSLGRAETQVHVEADGQVVCIVRDEELHDFLLLAILLFHKREDKATVGLTHLVELHVLPAAEDDALARSPAAVGNVEILPRTGTPVRHVVGARTEHHRHHVVDAGREGGLLTLVAAIVLIDRHVHGALPTVVAVAHVVHSIVRPFVGVLVESQRHEPRGRIGREGVAHHEKLVRAPIGRGDEISPIGRFAGIGRLLHFPLGRAHLHPHETPIEVEVEVERFAVGKGGVRAAALRRGRIPAQAEKKKSQKDLFHKKEDEI